MKSLISVVIVLVVGSAFAQTNTNTVPQTAPAATPAPTQAPAPAKTKAKAAAKKEASTPAAATAAPAVAAPSTPAAAGTAPATPTTPATSSAAPVNPDAAPLAAPAPAADATGDIATDDEAPAATADYRLPQGLLTNLGLTYYSREINETVNASIGTHDKVDLLTSELKVGWVFGFGLFAGATVHYDTGKFSGNSVKTQYAGPTIGWSENNSGILATATYHVVGTMDLDTLGKYDQVTGLQIDVSYPMSISEKLKFGPQLTWRNMKQEDGDNGLADEKSQELVPFMGVWYVF